jgi:hypothetical protein
MEMVTTTPPPWDSLKPHLNSNRISKLSYIWQREIFYGCTVSEVKAPLRHILALVTHLQEDLAQRSEEAKEGYLQGGELWLFTNNATAKDCFFCGGSSSKLFHKLVLHLRKMGMEYDFTLHMVHVTGTRMINQGTDGLSRGIFLEGVVRGEDMLSFVDLSQTAIERHPGVLDFVKSWVFPILGEGKILKCEEWFREGHGIIGGKKDLSKLWIPRHADNGKVYI